MLSEAARGTPAPVHQPAAAGSRAGSVDARLRGGALWIVWGTLGISLAVLTPFSLVQLRRDSLVGRDGPAIVVEIIADGMRFAPDEIHVPRGAVVQVEFANHDASTPHDFQTFRQKYDARALAWPGEHQTVVFTATDNPGRYAFICTVRGHSAAGMSGVIVVD